MQKKSLGFATSTTISTTYTLSFLGLVFIAKISQQYLFPLPGTDAVWYLSPMYEFLRGHWFHNGFANQDTTFFLGYCSLITPFFILLNGSTYFLFFFYDLLNVFILFMLWKLLRQTFTDRQSLPFILVFLCTPIFWHYRPEQLIFLLFVVLFLIKDKPGLTIMLTVVLALVHPFAGLVAAIILVEANWHGNKRKLLRIGVAAAVIYLLCIFWVSHFVDVSKSTGTLADMMQTRLENFSLRNFVEFFKYSFPIVLFSLACVWGYLKANPKQCILMVAFAMFCLFMNKPYYFYYLDFYLLWKVSVHGMWPKVKWMYAPLLVSALGINVAKPFYPFLFENGMDESQQIHKILNKLESLSMEITYRQIHIPANFATPLLSNENVRMLYFNNHTPSFTTLPKPGDYIFLQHPYQVAELQNAYPNLLIDSSYLIHDETGREHYCLIQLEVQ
ncbi:MAG: hypothetical protein EXR21_00330 [Flavobacteriaceae bacterium]|nr:hypothetical protein [Flavobacteriaceae bacterium]